MFWYFSSEVQTCEAPSSPRCFRRKAADSVYRCEWHMKTTDSRAKYDLFYEWVFQMSLVKMQPARFQAARSSQKVDLLPPQVLQIKLQQNCHFFQLKTNLGWGHRGEAHSVSRNWHLGGSSHRKCHLHIQQVVGCTQWHRYAAISVTH